MNHVSTLFRDPGQRGADVLLQPYWADARPAVPSFADAGRALPREADVVVVGAGLTGVEAARVLADAGRDVLVIDAGRPGDGASTRNAGQVGRNFKHSFGELSETLGIDTAKSYFTELREAYDSLATLGAQAGSAIGWRKCSRVVAAMSAEHLARLHVEYEKRALSLGEEVEFLDASQITLELGSPLYKGGVRIIENGAIHPGMYYEFMHDRTLAAGARVVGNTPVQAVTPEGDRFEVTTSRGRIRCRNVLIATNGYTGDEFAWFKHRLAPINSYMIATEPLPEAVWQDILPKRRTYHDNRRRAHFMTFSPDGTRLLFGGRTGSDPASLRAIAERLHADLRYLFPALDDVRISHAWTGRCAATRDLFPHVGVNPAGLHYALGYCFSGNAMGPYLARKAAALILGSRDEAHTLFDSARFPVVPAPARSRWMMPLVMGYYAWADRPKGLARAI
jgi:glycine/D-amino acid oxidase-like deaminating enzyme